MNLKKNVKIFGKSMPAWMLAVLLAAPAMALVTVYATISGDVTVNTPISASPTSWSSTTHYAGDPITKDFSVVNSANERDITVSFVGEITDGDNNIESGEIEKVQLKAVTDEGDFEDCTVTISGGKASFDCGSNQIAHSTTEDFTLKVVFAPYADAKNYTITLNINPA